MNFEKILPIVKGMVKHIPGVKSFMRPKTGGTNESRYCYSVWMRHLKNWNAVNKNLPVIVAELGPGDSLGIGLAALLSGSKQVYALDVVKYWDNLRNLKIFNELVELFQSKSPVPGNDEYPEVRPELENKAFPSEILTDNILSESLSKDRLDLIRREIMNIDNPDNTFLLYKIPWYDSKVIQQESVDFIYSQAVLEHVEDLENTYKAMRKWLKPSGLMSHTIDFRSHGTTKSWNGHWTYSRLEWLLVKGGKSFKINRQPLSRHIHLHASNGFEIISQSLSKKENKLNKVALASEFTALSEEDITTSGVYILSKKTK